MTEQTTALPTPAADAAKALREQHNAEFAVFSDERTRVLSATLSKDEAVDRAMETSYEPRSYFSKKTAIEEIVATEWSHTEIARATNAAERLADREGQVVRRIARSSSGIEWHAKKMREALDSETTRYNSDNVIRIALDLQRAMQESNWWDRISKHIAAGMAPLDALDNARAEATDTALARWEDPTSRSTSLAANISKDQHRFSAVNFLEETKDLARRD